MNIASVACRVDTADGVYECRARSRLTESDTGADKPLVVGDRVRLRRTAPGEGVISEVLPRRNRLTRTHPHDPHIEHVIVANVDQLLVVCSVREPPLTVGIIDRYIIAALYGGLTPLICINKIDMAGASTEHEEMAGVYRDLGYPVLLTSAETGAGIELLKQALKDRSTVLAGHSGVGKSSLINVVQPGLELKTAPIGWKGTHCTSAVTLLKLDFGGYVADTPGVRELNPWDIRQRDVAQFFPEIWELSQQCKMPACLHTGEPDCAVLAALERGELLRMRYDSYIGIVNTIQEQQEPRRTDVTAPRRQVTKKMRLASRTVQRQRRKRKWQEDLYDSDEGRGTSDE